MQSKANTVEDYLAELPEERREAIEQLRKLFKKNIDKKLIEHMSYGMISYSVPHSVYPPGYHCDPKSPLPFASMASQKNNLALYFFGLYMDPDEMARFQQGWKKSGKRLDMGKSCVRFKRLEDVPLEVVANALRNMTVDRFVGTYEASRQAATAGKAMTKKAAKK
ncbi:MAG: DUF1801 domain-containing protein [Planctomycetes bacterium]|nr:DUF1801 domain-containing protein [Planctomycetota bacterium]